MNCKLCKFEDYPNCFYYENRNNLNICAKIKKCEYFGRKKIRKKKKTLFKIDMQKQSKIKYLFKEYTIDEWEKLMNRKDLIDYRLDIK